MYKFELQTVSLLLNGGAIFRSLLRNLGIGGVPNSDTPSRNRTTCPMVGLSFSSSWMHQQAILQALLSSSMSALPSNLLSNKVTAPWLLFTMYDAISALLTEVSQSSSRPHCNTISCLPIESLGIPSKQVIFQRAVWHVIKGDTSFWRFCTESPKTDKINVLCCSDASYFYTELLLFFH